jgi:hypothetical protein
MNVTEIIKLYRERLTQRTVLVAAAFGLLGILLLWFTTILDDFVTLQVLVRELGGLFVVSGVITVLWDLFVKRALLDETLAKVGLSQDIEASGLRSIHASFQSDALVWDSHFTNSKTLDLFFISAHGWRSNQFEKIKRLLDNVDGKVRVVLPDAGDDHTVTELARRFGNTSREGKGEVKNRINKAYEYFENLEVDYPGKVSVWFLRAAPQLSFYIFEHTAVLALSSHRQGQISVPTLVGEKGGYLYNYLQSEFDAMVRVGGLARPA